MIWPDVVTRIEKADVVCNGVVTKVKVDPASLEPGMMTLVAEDETTKSLTRPRVGPEGLETAMVQEIAVLVRVTKG